MTRNEQEAIEHRRAIRRLTLQLLYQIEARDGEDLDDIQSSLLEAAFDPDRRFSEGLWAVHTMEDPADHERAFDRARLAWAIHEEADEIATKLAPDWPTHRQPALDRNVIRLCWFEMTSGSVPHKVALNEAIELAKQFGTERSAPFLNGVLDRMLRMAIERSGGVVPASHDSEEPGINPIAFPMETGDADQTDFWSSDHS